MQLRPTLTTVRQDLAAKGHAPAAALTATIKRAKAGTSAPAEHVLLPTELVIREGNRQVSP